MEPLKEVYQKCKNKYMLKLIDFKHYKTNDKSKHVCACEGVRLRMQPPLPFCTQTQSARFLHLSDKKHQECFGGLEWISAKAASLATPQKGRRSPRLVSVVPTYNLQG